MDINEINSFKLSDAVKFHSELNPKLWKNDQLDSLVKKQLLIIAEDFIEELGISGLDVVDVTVSGSNAAYSYTPHSDLDLHILVDMSKLPEDEVYRELFNAKKTIYNDSHDITVHGVPVELYVQDAAEPVVSLGEYSIVHDKWIKVPKRRRANFDQNATKAKYEQLSRLIKLALKSKDVDKINKAIKTIKRYRKAGLDKGGEFGPENLAYKALRKQGAIQQLYDTRDKLHSEKLSIEEFGIDEDYDPNGPPPGPEFKPTMPKGTVRVDVSDVYDWYKLGQHISNMKGLGKHDFGKGPPSTILSFGDEDLEHQYIKALAATGLDTTDIDPIDPNQPKGMKRQKTDPTYNVNETDDRTAAVLKIQKHLNKKYGANLDLDGKLGPLTLKSINKFMPRASKGLADEPNKTTAVQGKKLKEAPRTFQSQVTPLEKLIQDYGYFISTGTVHLEKNGETPEAQQKLLALVQRLQKDAKTFVGLDKTKMEANRDAILNHIHQMMQYAIPILKKYLPAEKWEAKRGQINSVLTAYNNARQINEASDPKKKIQFKVQKGNNKFATTLVVNGEPAGVYQYDANTSRSIAEVYPEYKGKGLGKLLVLHAIYTAAKLGLDFIEDESRTAEYDNVLDSLSSNGYIVDDDGYWYVTGDGENYLKQSLNEASGYIPSEKEKNDPRFKTALTVDVKPDSIKKNAKAFNWKTSRAGIPPQANPSGKF